ncbi:MAG: 30S ribosomal protein S2 [Parcubacteria group bacterium GW2011_GWF2_44_8]|nr:MAG: 30S ribosomal protein S2 [Parcubacteria group bacterium GW2011_GWF2_44_8]
MLDLSLIPKQAPEYDLALLLEAGCHFGHQRHKWHPKMAEYIYMEKDGVHIFDLAKTAAQLQDAYNYVYQLGKTGKSLVFVGTKRSIRDVVKTAAVESGAMFITSRWLGGLLTNWDQVKLSLKRMVFLEEGLKNDSFKGYTKFERMQFEKELGRLIRFFDGVRSLKDKPDCLFVVDPAREKNAVSEATKVGVPVIGLADSNSDPTPLSIAIPANDDAVKSVELITAEIAKAYLAGKAAA